MTTPLTYLTHVSCQCSKTFLGHIKLECFAVENKFQPSLRFCVEALTKKLYIKACHSTPYSKSSQVTNTLAYFAFLR